MNICYCCIHSDSRDRLTSPLSVFPADGSNFLNGSLEREKREGKKWNDEKLFFIFQEEKACPQGK